MATGRLAFKEQPKGYDKRQVNNYIKNLKREYETTYIKYLDMLDSYYDMIKFLTNNIRL